MDDRGGWVHWADTDTIVLGTPQRVSATQSGEDAEVASGTSDGDWVEVGSPEETLFRAPTVDASYELSVPEGQLLRSTKWGHEPSPWTEPGIDVASMSVRVDSGVDGPRRRGHPHSGNLELERTTSPSWMMLPPSGSDPASVRSRHRRTGV